MSSVRQLRSNTRKDYNKMAGNEDDGSASDGGGSVEEEVLCASESESVDEGELQAMEEEIKSLKLHEEKQRRKSLHKELKKEAELVRKNVEEMKRSRRSDDYITMASLRGSDDITRKVDRLMDKKLKVGKKASVLHRKKSGERSLSSSSGQSSSSQSRSSSAESSDDCSADRRKQRKMKKRKHRKSSKKSGKSKHVTSSVKFTEKWPQAFLGSHLASKKKEYEDLSLAEFVAGYSAILEECSPKKKDHRIKHLKDLMYLATKFHWRVVLQFHAACLLEIERGNLRWGDSFQDLQYATLAGGSFTSRNVSLPHPSGVGSQNIQQQKQTVDERGGRILFCKAFQYGFCSHSTDHQGLYKGENCLLKHICANCWLNSKKINVHPENSESCPLKNSGKQS